MSERTRAVVRGVGETLMTLGAVLLLYVVWSLWFTGIGTAREQVTLYQGLTDAWATPTSDVPVEEVPIGDGVAILRIPYFGPGYHPVVLQGTTRQVLRSGPGHYTSTAMPGQVGNFAIAGHRTTYGAPFNRIDELTPGTPIVVETADAYYTYQVTGSEIVRPTKTEVIAPVPGHPGETPTTAVMTFTTCHPEYSSRQRLVVYSELVDQSPRANGPPPVLTDPAQRAPQAMAGGS